MTVCKHKLFKKISKQLLREEAWQKKLDKYIPFFGGKSKEFMVTVDGYLFTVDVHAHRGTSDPWHLKKEFFTDYTYIYFFIDMNECKYSLDRWIKRDLMTVLTRAIKDAQMNRNEYQRQEWKPVGQKEV